MAQPATRIFDEPSDVDSQLAYFGISRAALSSVAQGATSARADVVANHPITAPGTFAYHYGTLFLREAFLADPDWQHYRKDNLEGVRRNSSGTIVIFQNTHTAAKIGCEPKPISAKGNASARIVANAHHGDLLAEVDPAVKASTNSDFWYFCVSPNGDAEISRPFGLDNGDFTGFHERIFICQGNEPDDADVIKRAAEVIEQDFDVKIERR